MTITHTITTCLPYDFQQKLTISVTDIKPFLYKDDVFQHVASYSDMQQYPEDTGTIHRKSTVDLIFRNPDILSETFSDMTENIEELADIMSLQPFTETTTVYTSTED